MKKLLTALLALSAAFALQAQTGNAVPSLSAFDRAMQAFLQKYKVPGAALAVAKDNRLVLARGYGFADRDLRIPVQPDSLFRIGSISKPVTVMTALRLVQDGRLSLDAPILPLLGREIVPPESVRDPRWNQITVRHLMQHSGGWDSDQTFDPLTSAELLGALDLTLPLRQPVTRDQVIRVMASLPLQFAPGTRQVYSNFGLMLLGRLIERVTGTPYEELVQTVTLAPMGIQRMAVGRALPSQRRLGEVEYYDDPPVAEALPAIYPGIGEFAPAPDGGGFYMEIIEGAGAWIASPVDLVRFINGVDGRTGPALLRPDLIREMTARPSFDSSRDAYIGLGWLVDRANGIEFGHNGAIEGTYALLARTSLAGVSFAITFNTYPYSEAFEQELFGALASAALSVTQWPDGDEFPSYLPATLPRISGVVEAAGQTPRIAPGAVVTIHGLNLGGGGSAVEVLFDGSSGTVLYSSRNQINAVAPATLASASQARVEVLVAGRRSPAFVTPVAASAAGLFTLSGNGRGNAYAISARGAVNGEQAPAGRGETISLFATGLDGREPVRMNGTGVEVLARELLPGLAGISRLDVRIPAGLEPGRAMVEIGESRRGVWIWVR